MDENQPPESPLSPVKPTGKLVAIAVEADKSNPDGKAKITAAGRGALAAQILEMAFAKGIKVREDAALAEILAQMEIDSPIPSEAVMAVAEILAKVYQANAAALEDSPPPPQGTL